MFLSYEHNPENNDIDRKKNGLYIKIERTIERERERERERESFYTECKRRKATETT